MMWLILAGITLVCVVVIQRFKAPPHTPSPTLQRPPPKQPSAPTPAPSDLHAFEIEKPHGYFDQNTKKENKHMEKGREYENFIAQEYAQQGYGLIFHRDLGKQDQKIDLIVAKGEEVLFIQCKNWNEKTGHRVGLDYVQKFLQNCDALEKAEYRGKNCQRLLILSSPVLEKEAWQFIKEHTQDLRVDFKIIEHKEGVGVDYAKKYRDLVAAYYAGQGFNVKRYDESKDNQEKHLAFTRIDLILRKDKQIIFAQCRNWNPEGEHKIDAKYLEKFLQDCHGYQSHLYRDDFEHYKQCFFKNIVVLNSSKLLALDAFEFIKSQKDKKEHERVFYEVLVPSSSMDKVSKYESKHE
ncbi:restriction endonuclease [Helicobacter felis]|uniref:restriction endonuclease n=1 Tax=Helicobacter felis TaxID=214 RepID=UPI000CF172A8|nr:restriction endonuclease [Helicobacter felis]